MTGFVLRRLLLLVPVLFGLAVIVFGVARLLPGDPARLAAGPNATAADVAAIGHEFGLDRPVYVQFGKYLAGLVTGDWGRSILSRRPVSEDLANFVPATLELVLVALALAILVGVPAGVLAASARGGWLDGAVRMVSVGAISLPRFFIGLLLQLLFAAWLGWFPLAGRFPLAETPPDTRTGFLTVDALLAGDLGAFATALQYLALPALALSLAPLATILRVMRASVIEALQQDYVLTERALGLPPMLILWKYVLRNAASPTVTVTGLYFGWLLGGTVLVETVFDWPGIGLYATESILNQDFMPIVGVTLCIGLLFVAMNLLVDLALVWLNPQVRA